ncbi:g4405 [Coccomyxa elongata]
MASHANIQDPLAGHPRYTKIRDLNRGSYGFVQLAYDKTTGMEVAIKFLQRGERLASVYVEREIVNHSSLLHPHIVQFKEAFLTREYLAIAMEYVDGGDMFQYVKVRRGLQETEARWFFQQVMIALDYLHRVGVVSRDVKLENTLLDGNRRPLVKICDFGYSKHTEKDSVPKSRVGTPGYTAPEIVTNRRNYDGKMVDVWSAGVMLYVMLFCTYPFERPEDDLKDATTKYRTVLQRVIKADFVFPHNIHISDECKDLISKILVVDPEKRLTVQQIQQHPWYLQDLPAGLDRFNDECLVKQRDMPEVAQNVEEVRKIVRDAMVLPPNSAFANGSALMDGFIDDPEVGMEEDGILESASSY